MYCSGRKGGDPLSWVYGSHGAAWQQPGYPVIGRSYRYHLPLNEPDAVLSSPLSVEVAPIRFLQVFAVVSPCQCRPYRKQRGALRGPLPSAPTCSGSGNHSLLSPIHFLFGYTFRICSRLSRDCRASQTLQRQQQRQQQRV